MFKVLRIICCVISALCVAGCVFAFIFAGTVWGIATVVGAVTFFALTVLFKRFQEDEEKKVQPQDTPTTPDSDDVQPEN